MSLSLLCNVQVHVLCPGILPILPLRPPNQTSPGGEGNLGGHSSLQSIWNHYQQKSFLIAYQVREFLHWLHLIEAIHLVFRQLKPEVGSESHQRLTVCLEGIDKAWRWFVQSGCSNGCENFSTCCLWASPMRSSQKHNSNSGLADAVVPALNCCLKKRLDRPTLETCISINLKTELFDHNPAKRMPNKYDRSAQLLGNNSAKAYLESSGHW